MDQAIANFVAITDSTHQVAERYLNLSDGNLEQAMQLYFDSGGADLEQDIAPVPASTGPATTRTELASSEPQRRQGAAGYTDEHGVVHLDSDDDDEMENDDSGILRRGGDDLSYPRPSRLPPSLARGTENDEDIARRMQEELFAGGDMIGDDTAGSGVRAPIARTTETLVGPDANWQGEPDAEMTRAIEAQIAARRRLQSRPGIFNQRLAAGQSTVEQLDSDLSSRRRVLAQATGGASEASSKASTLAELYRPPIEIMSRLPWDAARDEGKANEKWLLVNVQYPAVFDCQVLNRDIWKDKQIQATIKENFIFMQYNKDDPRGAQYIQFYFRERDDESAYPHIAIVDPRTGEQVKVWSGPPIPKVIDFLMELHDFLDRYSLKADAKNPISPRKAEKQKAPVVDVNSMTEEQMLEMALQNSLASNGIPENLQPDVTMSGAGSTKPPTSKTQKSDDATAQPPTPAPPNGHAQAALEPTSPFSTISSSNPHTEPPADPSSTTRIQFRHSGGRVIRRFALTDRVRRIYEWLKAEPLADKTGVPFELVSAGRNLVERLDETIEEAGLKNQTVMIEWVED